MCVYPKTLGENTNYMVLNTVKYISVNLLLHMESRKHFVLYTICI